MFPPILFLILTYIIGTLPCKYKIISPVIDLLYK